MISLIVCIFPNSRREEEMLPTANDLYFKATIWMKFYRINVVQTWLFSIFKKLILIISIWQIETTHYLSNINLQLNYKIHLHCNIPHSHTQTRISLVCYQYQWAILQLDLTRNILILSKVTEGISLIQIDSWRNAQKYLAGFLSIYLYRVKRKYLQGGSMLLFCLYWKNCVG